MALEPLATVDDLTLLGLTVDPTEEAFVARALDVASAAVREAAGSPISETTSTLTLEGEPGQWLTLPGQPVTAVATVLLDEEPATDWRLRNGRLWRARGWTGCDGPSEVEVTQTHGLPTTPVDIVDLVCRMVAAAVSSFRSTDDGTGMAAGNITSERIGDYAVTFGSNGLITEMELPDYERARLSARFGGGVAALRSR